MLAAWILSAILASQGMAGADLMDGLVGYYAFDRIDDFVSVPEMPLAEAALSVSIWGFANDAPTWASLVKNWGGSIVGQFHFGLGQGAADTLSIFVTQGDGAGFNAGTDRDPIELEVWEHTLPFPPSTL